MKGTAPYCIYCIQIRWRICDERTRLSPSSFCHLSLHFSVLKSLPRLPGKDKPGNIFAKLSNYLSPFALAHQASFGHFRNVFKFSIPFQKMYFFTFSLIKISKFSLFQSFVNISFRQFSLPISIIINYLYIGFSLFIKLQFTVFCIYCTVKISKAFR